MSEESLQMLRQEIDVLDERLIEVLAARFAVTERVGILKKKLGLPAVDEEREARQAQRLRELAAKHGVDEELALRVLRVVIGHVVANHRRIQAEG